jgi:hypothetical protein
MPAQLRNRTYTAEIRQVDSRISVQLGGREFSVNGPVTYNLLTGRVAGTTIVFDHLSGDWWGDYPPAIVEQLTSSSTLVITGRIVVSERGGRLDGTLDGRLDVMSQDGVMPTASCHATDHRVVLTR